MLLKPASEGTGVIAGAGVRAVLELGGVRDILAKSLGTANPINLLMATVAGLQGLKRPEDLAKLRGKEVREVIKPHSEVVAERGQAEAAAQAAAVAEVAEAPARPEVKPAPPAVKRLSKKARAKAAAAASAPPEAVEEEAAAAPEPEAVEEPAPAAEEAAVEEAPAEEPVAEEPRRRARR